MLLQKCIWQTYRMQVLAPDADASGRIHSLPPGTSVSKNKHPFAGIPCCLQYCPDGRHAYPLADSRNGLLYILDIQVPGSCDGVANTLLNVVCHVCSIQLGQVCLDQVCVDACSHSGGLQPTYTCISFPPVHSRWSHYAQQKPVWLLQTPSSMPWLP